MKKLIAIGMVIMCVIFCSASASPVGIEKREKYDNVAKISIMATGPFRSDHEKYDYSTSEKNEIAYILNYINNFHLEDDGENIIVYDVSSFSVKIHMLDGSVRECSFYYGRFDDESGKQYAIDPDEYNRFLEFIHALKTKKIILENEVTFKPSEWAKRSIGKAVELELIPGESQINYKGKITRLEVCRLIDNLLSKLTIEDHGITGSPFSDTTDKSVIKLYDYGIVNGKNESKFAPYDYITREELAKVLSNTYYLINEKVQSDKSTYEYADQKEISSWAYEYVGNMHSLNIMVGNPQNEFRPKDNVTKEETIITLLRIYSGQGNKQPEENVKIEDSGKFSYAEDYECYKDEAGVYFNGFVNVTPLEIENAEDAVSRAMLECTVEYNTVSVDYDSEAEMWKVNFGKELTLGGGQTVYMNKDGITYLIVYGE